MTISITENFTVDIALDYAKLCVLSKANWIWKDNQWTLISPKYKQLEQEMADKGYVVRCFCNDTDTGYSGTFFYNAITNKTILVNRGTDSFGDFYVDMMSIASNNAPTEQFRSMVNFVKDAKDNMGVGNFDIIGHSLGGCLAQMAKVVYASNVQDVYTYNAPGAMELNQNLTQCPIGWDQYAWAKYNEFFDNRGSINTSEMYNISGVGFTSRIANSGKDIGGEVFVNGTSHFIKPMINDISTGTFMIDPRGPVRTVIGSSRNEIMNGNYDSQHYSGSIPGNIILVGGYGNDELWGADGNDLLYGDLPGEIEQNQAEKDRSGNGTGASGNDYLYGGKGNDTLYGGQGFDTYTYMNGDGNDRISDQGNSGEIIIGLVNGSIRLGNLYKEGTGNIWKDASGQITLTNDTYWTITLPDSSTIQLEGLIQEGNFGFHFNNDPNDPVKNNVILGDQYPYPPRYYNDFIWQDTAGSDLILAGIGDDDVDPYVGGDDWVLGGEGSDIVNMWHTGNDVLEGGSGTDLLSGGRGDDKVFSENYGEMETLIADGEIAQSINEKGDSASGGWGNDYVYGSNRNDALFGGDGHDLIVGGGGNDAIFGDDDVDIATRDWSFTITQGVNVTFTNLALEYSMDPGDDEIYAGTGNDFVYAGGGDDNVYLGEGNDTGVGEGGYDFIDGDTGNDYLEGDASWVAVDDQGDDYIDGGTGNDTIFGGGGSDILYGGADNDRIEGDYSGTTGDDYIDGEGGADTLKGYGGDDIVFGGDGNDWIEGDSVAEGSGNDYLDGGAGNDTILGQAGDDEIYGGDDQNWLQGDAGNDYIVGGSNEDTILGGQGDDEIYGGDGVNNIQADAGTDYIVGGTGYDIITAGDGDDVVYGGDGSGDDIWGGAGNDEIFGGGGDDDIYGEAGDNVLFGDDGNDNITSGDGNDYVDGGTGNDLISAGNGANVLYGGDGNDAIFAGNGYDVLYGEAGDDQLSSGSGNDTLIGGEGNDLLQANGAGTKTLIGGTGDDTYEIQYEGASIVENAGEGNDTVQSWITYTLEEGANVENLTLMLDGAINATGNSQDNLLTGNSGANQLTGGGGSDTLKGWWGNDTLEGGAGNDSLYGGGYFFGGELSNQANGNDTYLFNLGSGQDVIFERDASYGNTDTILLGEGISTSDVILRRIDDMYDSLEISIVGTTDKLTVRNYFDYGYTDEWMVEQIRFADDTVWDVATIKQMTLQGTTADELIQGYDTADLFHGQGGNDTLYGGDGDDTIYGDGGNDSLSGEAGTDTLLGGSGDDTYIIDDAADTVSESADEGTDTVQTTLTSYTLGANVENLTLLNPDYGSEGTGNALNNVLTGYTLNDTLTGLGGDDTLDGGVGSDSLIGGTGDDTYVINTAGDVITENAGEGTDTIRSSIAYTLGSTLENLTLTGTSGLAGTGNASNNVLIGNSGANLLTGNAGNDTLDGGAGNDTMRGGTNDDTYVVANTGDVVTENAGEGTDTVMSSISHTLGTNVENLTLTGSSNINATGNTVNNVLTGNSGANTLSGGTGSDTMIGGGGNDIYVVDAAGDVVTENAGEGTDTVQTTLAYTLGANLENLTLTGSTGRSLAGNSLDNVLTGGSGADTLTGLDGNDTLDGGAGNDTMRGGLGNDTFVVGATGDVVTENAGEGTDTVRTSLAYTLGSNVENLTLTGSTGRSMAGNALDNVLTGGSGADTLTGNAGNDTLDGGAGNDTLRGGTNDDTYVVDSASDVVTENAGEGTDTVRSSINYTLGTNLENLTLTGSSNLNATGNTANNVLTGNSGANTLSGGTGSDTMAGGAGSDIYVVDAAGDVVTENADEGTDTVQSSIGYTLGANVENLTLTGSSNLGGTGNALDNVLTGNTGANALAGGAGNDTYVVDNAGDTVTENADEGTDTVQSSIAYTLGANVENLTLTGSSNLGGTGNALDNVLTGNTGANALAGGAGNDTYVVDNAGDVVTENADEGTDTVQSSIAYTLGANVENLTLTGGSAINGTGNALDNILTGNSAANSLDGGAGADTLIGGAGNDTYVVDAVGDVVTENSGEGTDTIQSSIAYTLGANVENLTLTGSTDIDGTGNTLDNVMTGNSGVNILDGGESNDTLDGAAGSDILIGGTGNDVYGVDDADDIVVEMANEGTDAIQSSITYTMGSNVENLTLTGGNAIDGTGNELNNSLTGNSAANTLNGNAGADTMTGGAGNDTYVVDNAGDVITEITGEGTDTVQSSIAYSLGDYIENLTLTGTAAVNGTGNSLNNYLTGNSAANILNGGYGVNHDTLDGGAGADTMIGGGGNDVYYIDNAGDWVTEYSMDGTDTIMSSISYTYLGSNIENLTLIGTDAINGSGNYNNNILTGNSAANTLNGGSGSDTMRGGAGDDVYVVEDAGDVVTENADEGTDTVQSSLSYTLGANVENLTLTGSSNLGGTGNALDNVLTGNTGANALAGGAGSDTYVVDNAGDTVTENAAEGTDTIQSSVSYTLGANVENLTLTGSSNLNGTGNTLNNVLTGNSGANTLTGDAGNDTLDGGAGADGLAGGTGDDVYFVDSGDAITENVGEGTDTVRSSISYTLSANVENLILTGSDAADGTGNGQDNTLTGNEAANTLDGGAGADTLIGGTGNDTYLVDNAADIVTENTAEGTDTVQSSITYTLSANVENLTLAGSSNLGGTGNAMDNVLTGNSGANALAGGAGSDTYVVDNAGDTVTENADEGSDTIQSSVSYTLSANVENLTLTGSSDLDGTGNALDNVLTGNSGTNVLVGGAGNDTYMVDSASDVVSENVSEGVDTVVVAFAYTLGANVENLTLTGVGAVTGTGNALDNLLTGNGAANTLDGGAGADTLAGGAGDDIYIVDNAGDIVNESASEGTDTVQSSITYTLAANVENLTLTGGSNLDGTGNALDNVLTGNSGSNILTGGAGNDVYAVDNAGDAVTENADEGADTIQSSITYTLSANVENLILTGGSAIDGTGNTLDNTLIGNGAANTLTGGAGSDTLDGGAGADTLVGGAGNDVFIVDDAGDVVTENSGEGTDTVRSWVAYTLSAEVENLTLTGSSGIGGTGNTLDNALTGNSAANTLTGNAGNDTLDGGAGGDALVGGIGNDVYIVDNAADAVTENADEGTDTIQSSITYTLSANVENLVLTGTGAVNGTGNALGNALTGNDATNVLDGGAGADTLAGGAGNDTYIVDDAGDIVTENADEGTDTIQSSITFTLAANVENLTLTGGSAIDGAGNALDNVLTGNGAANTLTGDAGTDTLDGGAGADTLAGGTGNDLYVVDSAGDVITESADEGTDSVVSSVTYTLGANVENLTLNGTGPIDGTGNALDNVLTGDAWANTLTGDAGNDTLNGSASADTLVGGAGDDLYVVENAGDIVTENSGEGTDTVQSSVAFTLGAYVENLTLTGGDAVTGTGNSLDNLLTGNSGANDIIAGVGSDTLQGGAGNDTLDGGVGSDTYVFSRTDGVDTISDYSTEPSDSDVINLDGIYDSEPILVKQNSDLYVFIDESNYLKVADQFTQSDYGVERIAVTDGYYITRQDIENIIDTMSSINNDAGMDLIQKYNNMRNSELYVSTLAQSWQQS